jgi:hypothetical protein
MLIEFILIGISIVFILFLVSMRYFKIAYAKGGTSVFFKTDKKIFSFWQHLKRIYLEISRDLTELVKDLPHLVIRLLNKIFYKLYKKTKRLIKGNKVSTNKGAVSLYLKRIEKDE